jgi:hypothetical protein
LAESYSPVVFTDSRRNTCVLHLEVVVLGRLLWLSKYYQWPLDMYILVDRPFIFIELLSRRFPLLVLPWLFVADIGCPRVFFLLDCCLELLLLVLSCLLPS